MKEWDDLYQEMVALGKRPPIASMLKDYKKETEAFYKDWARAEANGSINNPVCWGDDQDDDE